MEIEGFAESTSSSKQNSDFEEEEVDLNSLIEGDVDEIDEELGKNSKEKFGENMVKNFIRNKCGFRASKSDMNFKYF